MLNVVTDLDQSQLELQTLPWQGASICAWIKLPLRLQMELLKIHGF
jgi:hypothetical protein